MLPITPLPHIYRGNDMRIFTEFLAFSTVSLVKRNEHPPLRYRSSHTPYLELRCVIGVSKVASRKFSYGPGVAY